MSAIQSVLLSLGMALAAGDVPSPTTDLAHLRELLQDRQHPQTQSQAALLLVQGRSTEAEALVRQGLRQTEVLDQFVALAAAIHLEHDERFLEELVAALKHGRPAVRQAATEALSGLPGEEVVLRLQSLASDEHAELDVRRAALSALGRGGRKSAVVILLDALSDGNEVIRRAAAEALADLTGCAYGTELERWRAWWTRHRDMTAERWLEERVAYHASRSRRLDEDLDRARAQVVSLQQQLYSRLPAAERPAFVQSLVEWEDPAVRGLAVNWSAELLPGADALGQKSLADTLLRLSADGSVEVQRTAALALGRVNDPRAFERLRALVAQAPTAVRAAAARALAQQARTTGPDGAGRQRQAVALLQKSLDDSALEVVVEAAEDLGSLGISESSPILMALLQHPSESVRQTAAQALERIADTSVLEGLLLALADSAVPVRFSLVGAIGHAVGDGRALTETQRARLHVRLAELLQRDVDAGVRSRAATLLGECGTPLQLATLWPRARPGEDSRVQEKAWGAFVEIVARSASIDLLREWDRTIQQSGPSPRRLQLLIEIQTRWQKREDTKSAMPGVTELLVQAQLDQGKWSLALPLVHDLLLQPGSDLDVERRLRWLLAIGQQALKEGNRPEALHAVQEAQTLLPRSGRLAGEFGRLEQQARQ